MYPNTKGAEAMSSVSQPDRPGSNEFVTSRGFLLPEDGDEFGERYWFNMWKPRLWPYNELQVGDTLFWYDSKLQEIVWRTTVTKVDRFDYENKEVARQRLIDEFEADPIDDPYFLKAADRGYCLAFKVKPFERLSLPKPDDFKFPQGGWLRCEDQEAQAWLSQLTSKMTTTQVRILRVLSGAPGWMTRQEIAAEIRKRLGVTKGFDTGYSEAMGAPTTGHIAPHSLEGRGFVEHQESIRTNSGLEYRITSAGKQSLDSVELDQDLEWRLNEIRSTLEANDYFDPGSLEDDRDRKLQEIVQRRGQPAFRNVLLSAYGCCCAVTGADAEAALEAAHITPYLGPESNHLSNGILLRGDIHTLLDLNLIGIDPTSRKVVVAAELRATCYGELDGQVLSVPTDETLRPSKAALEQRWASFKEKNGV